MVAPVMFALGKAVHEKVVPTTFFGDGSMVMKAVCPLQMVKSDPEADGKGFTVTTRSTGVPLHPLLVGVIRYVTMPSTFPVFSGVSLISPLPEAVTVEALIVPLIVAVQVKVVPPIVEVGMKLKGV